MHALLERPVFNAFLYKLTIFVSFRSFLVVGLASCWYPAVDNFHQSLFADFRRTVKVWKLKLRGCGGKKFVREYRVQFSGDGVNWKDVGEVITEILSLFLFHFIFIFHS